MAKYYPALIHRDETEGKVTFGLSFPDLPGCVTAVDSSDELLASGREALQFHVDGILEDGETVPEPSSLDDAMKLAVNEEANGTLLVPVILPGRSKRLNISLDENLLEEIDNQARELGLTRSGFIAEACREKMFGKEIDLAVLTEIIANVLDDRIGELA